MSLSAFLDSLTKIGLTKKHKKWSKQQKNKIVALSDNCYYHIRINVELPHKTDNFVIFLLTIVSIYSSS